MKRLFLCMLVSLGACSDAKKADEQTTGATDKAASKGYSPAVKGILEKIKRKKKVTSAEGLILVKAMNSMGPDEYLEVTNLIQPPDPKLNDPGAFPPKDNLECNFSPMRPPDFPDFPRIVQTDPPENTERSFWAFMKKKSAVLSDWDVKLAAAGYKTLIYEREFFIDDGTLIVAIKGSHVVVGSLDSFPGDIPVSSAFFDYREMKGDMEFLLAPPAGLKLMGVEFVDDGLQVAYSVRAEGKTKASLLKTYQDFLTEKHPDFDHSKSSDYSALGKDLTIRYGIPTGIGHEWRPKLGKMGFAIEVEIAGCH